MPDSHRLSREEGDGEAHLRKTLAEIRIITGAMALGVARAALDEAVRYAAERKQFGKPINRYQAIQFKLAEMATELEAAEQLVHYAAWLHGAGRPHHKEAAMAKLYATEAAARICDQAARVLASYGYAMEYPVQRYLRDVRFTLIGGGTSEILKLIIAKEVTMSEWRVPVRGRPGKRSGTTQRGNIERRWLHERGSHQGVLAKPGLDGHDQGAKVVVRAMMDAGLRGDLHRPAADARGRSRASRCEEDADVIALSSMAGSHLPFCRRLKPLLEEAGLADKLWIIGGNLPAQDHDALRDARLQGHLPDRLQARRDHRDFIRENVP